VDLGLRDKVALVAGGSSGLGLAVAKELAAEGAHVAIGARDPGRLAAAERDIKAGAAGQVHAASVDITDRDAARDWVEETAAGLGGLHILVVSGGSPEAGGPERFAADEYERAIRRIVSPAVGLTATALPHMRAAGWGRVLFIASETASVPIPTLVLSGMGRAALVRFAQALAADVGGDGITVNVLAPAATRTQMVERAAARLAELNPGSDMETELAAMGSHNALGRIARPEEFAACAAFLASQRASFVTGQVLLVDGGASVMGPDTPEFRHAPRGTYT
jgi:3-oxoacyl-[acyl-carrier protein] reductase